MSLNEKEEKDVHTHETQPPEPSCVSVKSDACMRQPLNLSDRAVTSDPGASTNRKRKKKEEEEKAYASFYSTAYKMGRCVKREEEEDVHTHKAASPEPLPSDPDAKRADVIKSLSHQTRTVFETLMRQTVKDQHKTSMRNKYERLFEGIKLVENQTLLNRIYTELYIIEGESEEVNEEHEVLQMEKTTRTQYTSVNCNDIFKPLHEPGCEEKDQIKTVLTKGIAGIGKTVSVQKFILDWTEGKANQDIDFMFVLPFRELNLIKDHQYSLHRLLLDFHPELQDLTSETYEECKVVFIFDGLDESRITPMFTDDENVCDVNESSSVGVLMSNLIRGELLSSALIWITSRPAAANQIPSKYINRVTEIQGFNEHQKEKYFRKSIRDEHEASRVISHIKRSRSLHIMCHIPVFCWISATVLQNLLKQDHNAEIPQTLTEMYIHFLLTQINMRNQKYEERDPKTLQKTNRDVIVKLAELAFKQLMKGNVMFYEEDLIESGINVTDASVYSGICTEIFKEESVIHQRKVYCFIHLSFQEFLAAFFVFYSHVDNNDESLRLILKEINNWYSWQSSLSHSSSLVGIAPTYDAVAPCEPSSIPPPLSFSPLLPVIPPLPYQRKMKNSLYEVLNPIIAKSLQSKNGHLDLFLRFLLGVSLEFNQRLLSDLLTHTVNSSETIMTIRRYIRDTIKGAEHLSDRIRKSTECFTGLSDQIKPNIYDEHLSADRCINLFLCLLEMKDQTLYREIQEFVKSENHSVNRLSPSHCSTIAYILQISEVLDEFHLKKYNTSDEGRRRLIPAVVNCRKALFADCNLTGQCCKRLSSTLQSSNSLLRELDLSNNDLSDSSVKHLFDGMKSSHCQLNILRLSGCNLTGQCCESLSSSLQSSNSLKELDLSNNNLKDSGVKLLSDGMKSSYCQLNILRFDDCNLTGQCCESLSSYLQSSNTLRELDLSNNDLQDSGVMLLSDGLKSSHCQLNVLRLSGCMVTEEGCRYLSSAISSNPSHLRELDLCYNHPGQSLVKLLSDPNYRLEKLCVDHGGEFRITTGPQKYACDLTLDSNTASPHLTLSERNRKVTREIVKQPYPDHPERFDEYNPQVLCRESLTGCCYWEVEWSRRKDVSISVTYKGISRKNWSNGCRFGHNDKSWSLKCTDDSLTVRHNKKITYICLTSFSNKVGVYLNWSAGRLSFYSVSDTQKLIHLHTFNSTFTEPLYAGFKCYYPDSSVSLCEIKQPVRN